MLYIPVVHWKEFCLMRIKFWKNKPGIQHACKVKYVCLHASYPFLEGRALYAITLYSCKPIPVDSSPLNHIRMYESVFFPAISWSLVQYMYFGVGIVLLLYQPSPVLYSSLQWLCSALFDDFWTPYINLFTDLVEIVSAWWLACFGTGALNAQWGGWEYHITNHHVMSVV